MLGAAVGCAGGCAGGSPLADEGSSKLRGWVATSVSVTCAVLCAVAVLFGCFALVADRSARIAAERSQVYPVESFELLERADALVPEASLYVLSMGRLARSSNRRDLHDRAVGLLDEAVRAHPHNPYLRGEAAHVLLDTAQRFRECDAAQRAKAHVTAGLTDDPNSGELYLFLGSAHFLLGEFDKARSAWTRSADLLGRFGAAKRNLDAMEARLADPGSKGVVPCALTGDASATGKAVPQGSGPTVGPAGEGAG